MDEPISDEADATWAEYYTEPDPEPEPVRDPETGLLPWETPDDLLPDSELLRYRETLRVLGERYETARLVMTSINTQQTECHRRIEARIEANVENWEARRRRWIETQKKT